MVKTCLSLIFLVIAVILQYLLDFYIAGLAGLASAQQLNDSFEGYTIAKFMASGMPSFLLWIGFVFGLFIIWYKKLFSLFDKK
jgi:hypothetical protein